MAKIAIFTRLKINFTKSLRKLSNGHKQQLVKFEKAQLCQILGGCLWKILSVKWQKAKNFLRFLGAPKGFLSKLSEGLIFFPWHITWKGRGN